MSTATLVGLLITFVLCISGLLLPRNKMVFILQVIWFWILLAFSQGGGDYGVHVGIFENAELHNNHSLFDSWLYIEICAIFKMLGANFDILNFVCATMGTIILVAIIIKCSRNPARVMSYMLVYPLIDDIIQKRFFISSTIAVLGLYLAMASKSKKVEATSLACILVASFLHEASFAFLVFWIIRRLEVEKIKKILPFAMVLGIVLIPIIPILAGKFFTTSKVSLYFVTLKISILESICWMLLHLLAVFILIIIDRHNKKSKTEFNKEILKIDLISLVFLPLYYYEPTFIRILRTILLFNYIYISNLDYRTKNQTRVTLCLIWFLYLASVYMLLYVVTGKGFYSVVSPEYDYNLILNCL